MHCRIDFVEMASDTQALDRLADGLNQLYANGGIQARATLHDVNFFSGIQWAPQFLPGAPPKQRKHPHTPTGRDPPGASDQ